MIEDPIPAGTEFIERDNAYELKTRPPWWEYWFTRRELHDDRMAIFQTYFPQGQQRILLPAESGEPRLVSSQSGARRAHVSTRHHGHYREPHDWR